MKAPLGSPAALSVAANEGRRLCVPQFPGGLPFSNFRHGCSKSEANEAESVLKKHIYLKLKGKKYSLFHFLQKTGKNSRIISGTE
jgi:hypothetical protein